MGLFDRLFGRQALPARDPLIEAALQRAVELVEPRLSLARDWKARLTPAVVAAIDCARDAVARLEPVHPMTRSHWADDPLLRAVFPTADAVDATLRSARDVHRFFRNERHAEHALAVVGLQVERVSTFGSDLDNGRMLEDVQVEQLQCSAHQLRVVAADIDGLQRATGTRVFNDLMLLATRRLADAASRSKEIVVVRAMLQARLRMLDNEEEGILSDDAQDSPKGDRAARRADLEAQIRRLGDTLADLGSGTDALDRQLDLVRDTLLHAREALNIVPLRLRVDAMNRVLPDDDPRGHLIELQHVPGARVHRAFFAVSISRRNLPDGGLNIQAAERSL